jgi:hypothetical protein
LIDKSELDGLIHDFWSNGKSGKHNSSDLEKIHKDILDRDLLVNPSDLFEQLNVNKFTFQDFGPIKLSSFLSKSKLDSYLNSEYIEDALKVKTAQPAIGKGEFLLVSCFKNINFSNESGDLVDTDGNKIEVKGSHSCIGGSAGFDQMNKSIMFSIYNVFNTNPDFDSLTISCSNDLQNKLANNPSLVKKVMLLLQNNHNKSNSLAAEMEKLFNEKINGNSNEQTNLLLNIVAAAHLFAYLKLQKANFLFAINDRVFSGFSSPNSLDKSYDIIIKHFKINGWTTGNTGITFTLKAG